MEFLKLEAFMEKDPCGGFLAWISNSKKFNMVVKGDTQDEAAKELIISLKVAMSYNFGVNVEDISMLSHEEFSSEITKSLKENGKKELVFNAA